MFAVAVKMSRSNDRYGDLARSGAHGRVVFYTIGCVYVYALHGLLNMIIPTR